MLKLTVNPAGNYMFKVNYRNTILRCEICSKLAIETAERRHWRRSGVFILTFEQANGGWERAIYLLTQLKLDIDLKNKIMQLKINCH